MEGDGEYDRKIATTRGCNEETGGSCKEVGNDATDIEDDGSRNQIRDRDGSEEMENTGAVETHEKVGTQRREGTYEEMGTEDFFGYVHVLGLGRKTTES